MQFEDSIVVKIACTPLTQKKSTRLLLMLTSSRVWSVKPKGLGYCDSYSTQHPFGGTRKKLNYQIKHCVRIRNGTWRINFKNMFKLFM
jgi:hypothetical protein